MTDTYLQNERVWQMRLDDQRREVERLQLGRDGDAMEIHRLLQIIKRQGEELVRLRQA